MEIPNEIGRPESAQKTSNEDVMKFDADAAKNTYRITLDITICNREKE